MGDIAQRGNRLTFAKGGKGEKGEWIEPIKTKAKKDTESVRDVRAGGGRAGHALGMSAGKQAIKRITERLGGGPEGKPHSTRAGRIAAGVRKIKRGTKSWNKKDITNKRISKDLVQDVFNVVARKHSLGQQGKPHSSKEGRTASFGRTVRDVKKILSPERDKNKKGGRAGKAFGGPSHSVRRTVKKILKKAKAKKDTESVKDVR